MATVTSTDQNHKTMSLKTHEFDGFTLQANHTSVN